MKRVYLDYAATTPVHPDVLKTMLPYFSDSFGNPSSIYSYGQEAKAAIENARGHVAHLIGAHEDDIYFTGGGTESDNWALHGVLQAQESKGNHIITSAIEHHAILETCESLQKRGYSVTRVPVDDQGLVSPDNIKKAITGKTVLISIMYANNEIGTIEPIAEIGKIAREAGVCFHTDAVQAAGHIDTNVDDLGVDLLSMSAHKLYGPKGIGTLYIRKGTKIATFLHGGGQERGRRSGTENVPAIAGFGKAAEIAFKEQRDESVRLTSLRDMMIQGLFDRIERIKLNGHPVRRLPNNVNISIEFIEGESMLINLDLEGICASTGSACSSTSLEPSHVLTALGMHPVDAHGSLRFSLGKWTTEEDIQRVFDTLPQDCQQAQGNVAARFETDGKGEIQMTDAYSTKVMDHVKNPRNVGDMENPDGIGHVGNPVCGDIMELYIKVKNNIITEAKFKTFGCGAAIATSSMVTEMVKGKTIEEALKTSNRAVAEALGGLPKIKMHCSVLAEEALQSAIDDYLKKKGVQTTPPSNTLSS